MAKAVATDQRTVVISLLHFLDEQKGKAETGKARHFTSLWQKFVQGNDYTYENVEGNIVPHTAAKIQSNVIKKILYHSAKHGTKLTTTELVEKGSDAVAKAYIKKLEADRKTVEKSTSDAPPKRRTKLPDATAARAAPLKGIVSSERAMIMPVDDEQADREAVTGSDVHEGQVQSLEIACTPGTNGSPAESDTIKVASLGKRREPIGETDDVDLGDRRTMSAHTSVSPQNHALKRRRFEHLLGSVPQDTSLSDGTEESSDSTIPASFVSGALTSNGNLDSSDDGTLLPLEWEARQHAGYGDGELVLRGEAIERMFTEIQEDAHGVSVRLLQALGHLDGGHDVRPVEFVEKPEPRLEKVYTTAFGERWRERASTLELTASLHAPDVIVSMIGAAVLDKVFRKSVPWQTFEDFEREYSHIMPHARQEQRTRGSDFATTMRLGWMRWLGSKDFPGEEVEEHAQNLADGLALTLQRHIFGPRGRGPRIENDTVMARWADFRKSLTRILWRAMRLKGLIELEQGITVNWLWYYGPQPFNPDTMHYINGHRGGDIAYTMMPGISVCRNGEECIVQTASIIPQFR